MFLLQGYDLEPGLWTLQIRILIIIAVFSTQLVIWYIHEQENTKIQQGETSNLYLLIKPPYVFFILPAMAYCLILMILGVVYPGYYMSILEGMIPVVIMLFFALLLGRIAKTEPQRTSPQEEGG